MGSPPSESSTNPYLNDPLWTSLAAADRQRKQQNQSPTSSGKTSASESGSPKASSEVGNSAQLQALGLTQRAIRNPGQSAAAQNSRKVASDPVLTPLLNDSEPPGGTSPRLAKSNSASPEDGAPTSAPMSEVDRQKLASIQQLGLWPTQDPQVRAQQHQSPALMGLPDTLAIVGDGSLRDDQPLVLPSGATVESHTRQLDPNSTETTLTTRYRGQTMTSSRTDLHVAGAEGSKQTLTFGSDNRLDEITITRNDVTRHYFPVLDDQGHRIPGLYVGGDGAYRYPIQVATDDHGNPIAVTELPKQSDAPSGSSGHHGLLGDALRGGWNFGKGLVEPLRDTFAGAAGATGAFDGLSDETRRENNLPNRADILKGFKQQGLDLGTAMLADQKAGNHWGVLNEGSKLTIGTDWTQFPDHPAETAGNAVTGLALVLAPTKFLKGFRGERIPDLDYPDLPNGVLGGLGNSDHAVTTKIPGPAGNSARSAELQGSGLLPRDSGGSEPQQPQISSGLSAPTSGDGVRPPRPTYDPWNNHYDPWNDGLGLVSK
ncbi:hypothetical protein IU429_15320 [Nocardia elegans]|uniref:hypothetical protein n=1 Tax=Nocardia elegans TaxID=300029 RepID=UPI001894368A|nr:hypothetical protein [Nocardia elegans]MBF6449041.1 hypothetical protein [Nocardia elegans]